MTLEAAEPRIFGAVLLEQRRVMEDMLGQRDFTRGLAALAPDQRAEFENLTMLSWCRRTTVIAVSEAMAEVAGLPAAVFVQRVVREALEKIFGGVWQVLLKFNSDEALVKRASLIYSKTCDRGWFRASLVEDGLARIKMGGWPDIHELDAVAFASGIETVLRLAGRSYVKIDWHRRGDEVHFDVRTTSGSVPPSR